MNEQYYYAINSQQQGPVSRLQIRELAARGELQRNDQVWCPGMKEWQTAGSIAELFESLPPDLKSQGTPVTPPPLPAANPAPVRLVVEPTATAGGTQPSKQRSPGLMALASFILPGLGQLLCGQDAKGLFLIVISIVGNIATGGLSSVALCPLMSIDAYMIARKRNETPVAKWEFFPTWANIKKLAPHMVPSAVVAVVLVFWIVAKLEQEQEQDDRLQQNQEQFLNILQNAQQQRGY